MSEITAQVTSEKCAEGGEGLFGGAVPAGPVCGAGTESRLQAAGRVPGETVEKFPSALCPLGATPAEAGTPYRRAAASPWAHPRTAPA